MPYSRSIENQSLLAPIAIGLAALVIFAIVETFHFTAGTAVAELLLFMVPLAFGIRGACIVIAIAVLPWSLYTSDPQMAYRLTIIIVALGCAQRYLPMVPGYATALLTWMAVVQPTLGALTAAGATFATMSAATTLLTLVQDLFVVTLAGAFLFNDSLWWFITRRARYQHEMQLIPHLMTATSLTALFATLLSLSQLGVLQETVAVDANLMIGIGVVTCFVMIPSLFGLHISHSVTHGRGSLLSNSRNTAESGGLATLQSGRIGEEEWDFAYGINTNGSKPSTEEPLEDTYEAGVCALDGDGAVLFINDRFRALVCLSSENVVGACFNELAANTELVQYIWQLIGITDPSLEFVKELHLSDRKDGVKFIEINLRSHDSSQSTQENEQEDGQKNNLKIGSPRVIRITDITARRTIDHRLLKIQRLKAFNACATGAAPKLTEIFTTILGRASHALHVGHPAALSSALQRISEIAARGGLFAQQLNELTVAPEASTRRGVELGNALSERLPLLRELVCDGIDVTLQLSDGDLPVKIDTALLTQALSLIVMNSSEAYPSGIGQVSINTAYEEIDAAVCHLHPGSKPGNFARIKISDRGCGMSAEVLARVANPLLTTRGEFGHVGLDLPSVLAIMNEHDGFMTVESKPERGTTISLYFPIFIPVEQRATTYKSQSLNGAGKIAVNNQDKRVLIVEDSNDLRSLLQDMVKSLGYRSTACSNKDEALKLLQAGHVDILLIEDSLPGLSVQALIGELPANNGGIRTVLLSDSENITTPNSDAVIIKPFDIGTLSDTLKEGGQRSPSPRESH